MIFGTRRLNLLLDEPPASSLPKRPLVFCPSPRDIKEFNAATAKLKFDKLFVKYYGQQEAFEKGRDFFLEHIEYTHLIILPDDLLVTQEQIETLLSHNKLVVSGYCNVHDNNVYSNVSNKLQLCEEIDFGFGSTILYTGFKFSYLEQLRKQGYTLLQVNFAGFPPTVIHRTVIEQTPFRTYNNTNSDALFCRDIKNIKKWVDLRVHTLHLYNYDLQVGKKEPCMKLEQNGTTTILETGTLETPLPNIQ